MKIPFFAVNNQLVGQATSLGTLAPVGTALAQGFAGEALARIGNAKGSMHKHFQGHGQLALLQLTLQAAQVGERQLPGKHDPFTTKLRSHGNPCGAGDRHLSGSVHSQFGRQLASQPGQANVLNNQGIDMGRSGSPDQPCRLNQLITEYEHIYGEKSLHPPPMQPVHQLRQLLLLKISRPHTGVKYLHTEINGIGAICYRGAQGLPITRRGQQFRNSHQRANRWAGSNNCSASALPSNRQCQGS